MKKFYASFCYNDKQYVIRFKVKNFQYDPRFGYFMDSKYYIRTVTDMVAWAMFNTSAANVKYDLTPWLIDHKAFVELRADGIERWNPACEVLI